MTQANDTNTDRESLRREAWGWVTRLTSGEATTRDIAQMEVWRAQSAEHADAFEEASGRWRLFGPAIELVVANSKVQQGRTAPGSVVARRAFLAGAVGASAAGIGAAVWRPPLGFWPSLGELTADYRTAPGEQRRLTFDGDVSIDMNTRTSVNVAGNGADDRIELLAGEAAVRARSRKVELAAGDGRTAGDLASFNVRYEGGTACVTCLDGLVEVTQGGRSAKIQQNQQLVYSAAGFGMPMAVDANAVTGWRDGDLYFDNETLARVIDEINRYRNGRIFLMNDALGRKRLTAHFKIAKLDLVIGQLQTAYGAHARQLPGGIVLIS